jgi:beta-carotene hydroxylase
VLRHRKDLRSVGYLMLTVALFGYQWAHPGLCNFWLYPLSIGLCFTAAIMSHNHNHVAFWRWRPLNLLTSYTIGLFYGFPAFAWVPTHNRNHHHFNNSPGDESISPRFFRKNHLLALAIYPVVTEFAQLPLLVKYMGELRARDKRRYLEALSEYAVFFSLMILFTVLDWRKAVVLLYIPQFCAKYLIQCVGYFQHVDCDAKSEWNHSRNFVGPVVNALLFNNGFHTVHHFKPGVHWSDLRKLHGEYAERIDERFKVPNLALWFADVFFIAPLRVWHWGRPKHAT